jgi:hypothetical protein
MLEEDVEGQEKRILLNMMRLQFFKPNVMWLESYVVSRLKLFLIHTIYIFVKSLLY